jgi:hypothetical protein
MRTLRWLIPVSLALASVVAAAYFYFRRDLPRSSLTALRDADQFELLSLSPSMKLSFRPEASLDKFYNHEILGRATITDRSTRQQLANALRTAARDSDGSVAACFNPRHGIRVTRAGQVTDFVICFECSVVHIHRGGKPVAYVPLTRSAEPFFDAALRQARLPLAEKLE